MCNVPQQKSQSLLFLSALHFVWLTTLCLIPCPANAADQKTLNILVEMAKKGCLVGAKYDIKVEGVGKLYTINIFNAGGSVSFEASKINDVGAVGYKDDKLRLIADREIRECLRPRIDSIFDEILGHPKQDARLELVDAVFHKLDERVVDTVIEHGHVKFDTAPSVHNRFPVLEVALRNSGPVASIKEAIFKVERVWRVKSVWKPWVDCISWNYDVLLPISRSPNPIRVKMRNVLGNGETDRMTFTLGNDAPPSLDRYAFLVSLKLLYNSNNMLEFPKLFFISEAPNVNPAASSVEDPAEIYRHNMAIVADLGAFSGTTNSAAVRFLEQFSEKAVPALIEQLDSSLSHRRIDAANRLSWLADVAGSAIARLKEVAAAEKDPNAKKAEVAAIDAISKFTEVARPKVNLQLDGQEIAREAKVCEDKNRRRTVTKDPKKLDQKNIPMTSLSADQLVVVARAAFEAENYSAAAQFSNDAIKKLIGRRDSSSVQTARNALVVRGRSQIELKNFKDAVKDFTDVMELGSIYPYHWVNRGWAYQNLGDVERALADYNYANLQPDMDGGGFIRRANLFLEQEKITAAISDYREAVKRSPNNPEFYTLLASALIINRDYAQAQEVANQIIEIGGASFFRVLGYMMLSVAKICQSKNYDDDLDRLKKTMSSVKSEAQKHPWVFVDMNTSLRSSCPDLALGIVQKVGSNSTEF